MPMKTKLLLALIATLAASSILAADSKQEVAAAAAKLASQNYSWKSLTKVPESARFQPGPIEGKTEKDGYTYVTMSFGNNNTEIALKGQKAAITDRDGNWQLASELENAEGPGRFLARMAQNLKTPAEQVTDLLSNVSSLKKDGNSFSGDLTEEGIKKQFRFGEPQNPKGSVKFWLQDGALTKMEVHLEAKMEFNGNEFDATRTITTEIKDVGSTQINLPSEAKKKLS